MPSSVGSGREGRGGGEEGNGRRGREREGEGVGGGSHGDVKKGGKRAMRVSGGAGEAGVSVGAEGEEEGLSQAEILQSILNSFFVEKTGWGTDIFFCRSSSSAI